ncbi:MAG: bifunctional glycosyltransferase family 2/GtrA family protein [Solobacterium sp.]|nr:bifunctional glycosyltransferase family 2/GtrA family protein [Solobacterium sp.]
MKTAYTALIPAYCPDRKLIGLIQDLADRDIECIVVNDGSPEEYDELFHTVSAMTTLITHEENRGKGAALKTGMQYIRDHCGDCVVVTADADGQHLPEDILHTAGTADTCTDALVLGVRSFSREDTPFRSYYGNKITENVFRLFTGEHVTDTQTGLRAFRSTLIPCMLEVDGDRYEYEMNQLLYCVREKIPFQEVTITTVYENNNECSHFHPFRDSFLIYRQILRFGLSSLAGFAVDITAFEFFSLLFNSSTGILAANILARVISAVFNYEVNRNVVFRDNTGRKNSALKYFSLACTILLCNTVILYVLTGILGLSPLPSKIITEVILFLFSWTMQNRYVFNGSTGRLEMK